MYDVLRARIVVLHTNHFELSTDPGPSAEQNADNLMYLTCPYVLFNISEIYRLSQNLYDMEHNFAIYIL